MFFFHNLQLEHRFPIVDPEIVNRFLQPTIVNIVVEDQTAISKVRNELVIIPELIPVGMVIAVSPNNGEDPYWLACVTAIISHQPIKYKLHYYERNKQHKVWKLMKGKYSSGTCPHGAVLFAGVEFNQNGSMKKDSTEKISYMLSN